MSRASIAKRRTAHYFFQYAAHVLVLSAKRMGDLVPQPCLYCGSNGSAEGVQAHHEDYTKPYKVVWLCQDCHNHLHAYREHLRKNEEYKTVCINRKTRFQCKARGKKKWRSSPHRYPLHEIVNGGDRRIFEQLLEGQAVI